MTDARRAVLDARPAFPDPSIVVAPEPQQAIGAPRLDRLAAAGRHEQRSGATAPLRREVRPQRAAAARSPAWPPAKVAVPLHAVGCAREQQQWALFHHGKRVAALTTSLDDALLCRLGYALVPLTLRDLLLHAYGYRLVHGALERVMVPPHRQPAPERGGELRLDGPRGGELRGGAARPDHAANLGDAAAAHPARPRAGLGSGTPLGLLTQTIQQVDALLGELAQTQEALETTLRCLEERLLGHCSTRGGCAPRA